METKFSQLLFSPLPYVEKPINTIIISSLLDSRIPKKGNEKVCRYMFDCNLDVSELL